MHKKVLVCLPLNDAHRAALEASVPEFEFRFNALDDVHAEDVLWADVVLGNAPVSMIRQNKHIEWFQSNSAGPDAYLKPGVLPENCMVTNATGAYGLAISEWMLAMWLGIQKDMFLYRDRQNQRQWAPIDRPVRGITGARVLCVGMGDIGSNFARRAHMLGAEVVGVRRTVHPDTPCPDYCLRVVAQSQLDEELPEADLIALSLPGTPETNKLFNAERFTRCKDGAILINVGRGTTVDSDALVEALRSGKIFGAGLDVTDPEPLPADHPLWGEPGAIITPHNSGKFSLPKTLDNIVDIFIHNLKRYAEGLPLDNQVNRTPETNKLFNAERFAKCKDGAILINVGRGTTVDSDALVEALRSGKIFGAGLDVTDPEPLPADHPLWGEPGAIITPHNSGKFSLPKTLDNIVDIFIHNLKRYAEGLPLDNQVNRTTRYAADQNGGHRLLSTL